MYKLIYKQNTSGHDLYQISDETNLHQDQHSFFIHEKFNSIKIVGNDGGVYRYIADNEWEKINNYLPITQFYTCKIDPIDTKIVYGGTQDNGSLRKNDSIWSTILYDSDGFYIDINPKDNNLVYAEKQNGQLSRFHFNGNSYSKKILSGYDDLKTNWNTPFLINPSKNNELFLGNYKVNKSINLGDDWDTTISPNLTHTSLGDRKFGTITALAISKSNDQYIYVGTDNGHAWVSRDGGECWEEINCGLPSIKRWITRIAIDSKNPEVAYISLSGFRNDNNSTHLYKTTNSGKCWQSIINNSQSLPINDIIIDNNKKNLLYLATDLGVYYLHQPDKNLKSFNKGLPNVPVFDLDFHETKRILLAATHGRSMYKIQLK